MTDLSASTPKSSKKPAVVAVGKSSKFVTAATLRAEVDVSTGTFRNWANSGKVECVRLPGNSAKRLYNREQVLAMMGVPSQQDEPLPKKKILYARVSSHHQKEDLQRQIVRLQEAHPGVDILSDVGSGLNWKRRGMVNLLEKVTNDEISEVIVTYRDRLCRFGFDLLDYIFKKHGVTVSTLYSVTMTQDSGTQFNELAEDLFAVTNFFVARNNGARSALARRKLKESAASEKGKVATNAENETNDYEDFDEI